MRIGAIVRAGAVVLVRDAIPYAVASMVAAVTIVVLVLMTDAFEGRTHSASDLALMLVVGTMATFIYAMPLAIIFVTIGEWRRYGPLYYVLAAPACALASFMVLYLFAPETAFPWWQFGLVTAGGFAGGLGFIATRALLVRFLGDLTFRAPAEESPPQ
ncbi:hypothetical protein [Mesorhizobium sp. J428]|uniref:hypothetical protein n=1 Tax=Mesorhizobium sp. J428 TaxID=2898440 RepID=UPI0021518653|nr:hypothetical protein [Mesorhizobium sp. J428]MCR5857157.1 hypothetical protein [Mesorhizobium sp. J428]